jgi:hypothetical protein
MKNLKWPIIFDYLTLVFVMVVNTLAVRLPLNGMTTEQIADQFDVYFVPAGYVFLIWIFIYIDLIAFVIYRILPRQIHNEDLARVDGLFAVSNIANSLWLVSFHYQKFVLSLGFMLLLLVTLISIFTRLKIGKRHMDFAWRWIIEATFSIYLGWVTVATVANVTQVLDYFHWNGLGIAPEFWFVVAVVIVLGISAGMSFTRRAFEFNLVLIWALVGIALKFPDVPLVNYAAWGGAILIAFLGMVGLAVPIKMDQPNK